MKYCEYCSNEIKKYGIRFCSIDCANKAQSILLKERHAIKKQKEEQKYYKFPSHCVNCNQVLSHDELLEVRRTTSFLT